DRLGGREADRSPDGLRRVGRDPPARPEGEARRPHRARGSRPAGGRLLPLPARSRAARPCRLGGRGHLRALLIFPACCPVAAIFPGDFCSAARPKSGYNKPPSAPTAPPPR